MSAASFDDLAAHINHQIVCVGYGLHGRPPFENVALECVDCSVVLLTYDREDAGDANELANVTRRDDLAGVRDAVMADAAMRFESFGPLIAADRVPAAVEAGFEVWSFQYDADDGEEFTTIEADDLETAQSSLYGDAKTATLADVLAEWWGPFRLGDPPYGFLNILCPLCNHVLYAHNENSGCVATIPGSGYCPCTYRSKED